MKNVVIGLILVLVASSLFSLNNHTLDKSYLNNVNALYFYDTTQDDISGSWKSNTALSWYNEPSNPSDDFYGDLDSNRWEKFHGTTVANGIVTFSGPVLNGYWHGGEINSQNEWTLSGDFDIEITYLSYSSDNKGELRFEIKGSTDPNHFVHISRGKKADGTNVYLRNDFNNSYAETNTSDTEGRLRIVRSGNYVTTYYAYWDAGSAADKDNWKWTQLGSSTLFGNYEIYVRVFTTSTQAGVNVDATVDDFLAKYTSGCSFGNLGSHSRSTKKEFPDRVLLVATDMGLEILDADTYDVWMRFWAYDGSRDPAEYQNIVADKITYVCAKNGKIYTGANDGWMSGLEVIDFANDTVWFYDKHTGDGTGWNFLGDNLSERNLQRGWTDNTASYVELETPYVYNVDAKYIGGKTYVAVANGISTADNRGRMVTINIEDNTKSYDILPSAESVIDVKISTNGDNYLYYLTAEHLYCSYSKWRTAGDIGYSDASVSTSPDANENSTAISINNNNVFVSNEDTSANPIHGSITKRNQSTLSITTTYDETSDLPGTANTKAIVTTDNTLWGATNHSSYGKIDVIGLSVPSADDNRGIFDTNYYLASHYPNSISYCSASGTEYLAISYSDNTSIDILSSANDEISIMNPAEGEIEYSFMNGNSFDYKFQDVTITIDPSDSKATYGNIRVILHDGTPSVPFPEHALAKWFEIEEQAGYDAFPTHIEFTFTNPIPSGDNRKELFYSDDGGTTWTNADEDSQITDVSWNYTTSPYYVHYNTSHFSWWGVSKGDGDDPLPVVLSNFFADFVSETVSIEWITQSEINSAGWNIYKSQYDNPENASKINPMLIPSLGNGVSANHYSYFDRTPIEMGKTYYYWLENIQYDGSNSLFGPATVEIPQNENNNIPNLNFSGLLQNYPNPFNPETTISFALDYDSEADLKIYNIKGELVKKVHFSNVKKNSRYDFVWDGTNQKGRNVSSGVYLYRLITSKDSYEKTMVLIK